MRSGFPEGAAAAVDPVSAHLYEALLEIAKEIGVGDGNRTSAEKKTNN